MASESGSRAEEHEKAHRRNVSRAALWSYAATGAAIALWITLVVVNRTTSGEVRPDGLQAELLAVVMPLWTALGALAVVLAVIALVRSRARGHAFIALALAVFVVAVPILEQL
ncbi:hypothetical protein [Microbacterium sp. CIAB417]|uniref:hypothetical protein n=1 Tax=Microbacterium sp. CIAB417 TaxID=2860287 RepID=UPI001FACD0D6|nr:hypothetical protein [Microbacterium sp. CIAB417]